MAGELSVSVCTVRDFCIQTEGKDLTPDSDVYKYVIT